MKVVEEGLVLEVKVLEVVITCQLVTISNIKSEC